MRRRGKFLVLEGGVGAGKTTQERLLKARLSGWEFFREPGGTPFGEKVRDAVQGVHGYKVDRYAALLAYSASRANLIRGEIIPRLEKGANIVLDRYWYSTWAYQGAEGVSKPIIWLLSMLATRRLKPNLVLFYDLIPEIGMTRKRKSKDADRYDLKAKEFHQKVRQNYLQLKFFYPGIWRTIDASKSVKEISQDSLKALREFGLLKR